MLGVYKVKVTSTVLQFIYNIKNGYLTYFITIYLNHILVKLKVT